MDASDAAPGGVWRCAFWIGLAALSWTVLPRWAEAAEGPFAADVQALMAGPVDYDLDGLWQRFLAQADAEEAFKAMDALDAYASMRAPTAEECAKGAEALQAALAQVPVSLALHDLAASCASVRGDEATAQGHEAVFAALVALERRQPLAGSTSQVPIRVFSRYDAEVLVAASGYEVLNLAFEGPNLLDHYPLVFLVREDDGTTRHLYIDYFDVSATLAERGDTHPLLRMKLAEDLKQTGADGAHYDPAARVVLARTRVRDGVNDEARRMFLDSRGRDLTAMALMVQLCAAGVPDLCQPDDVDLLLDAAEQGEPNALATLALIHALGYLIPVNPARAADFYRLLHRRHDRAQAAALMAEALWVHLPRLGAAPGLLAELVSDLKDTQDHYPANGLWLGMLAESGVTGLGGLDSESVLRAAASAKYVPAVALVALIDARQQRRDDALRLLQSVPAPDLTPMAAYTLAELLTKDHETPSDEAQALMARAARSGQTAAMRWYATWYEKGIGVAANAEYARSLLLVAALSRDWDAYAQLLRLYRDHPDWDRKPLAGLRRAAEADKDNPKAMLAVGMAMLEDPAGTQRSSAGLRLVRKAQKAGLQTAYLYEADWWSRQDDIRAELKVLKTLLQRWPSATNKARYGRKLYQAPGSRARDRQAAIEWMRTAEQEGESYVLNDLAWRLCTRDQQSALGIDLARLAADAKPEYVTWDTLAACEAASGHWDAAQSWQQRAVDAAAALDKDGVAPPDMRHRLQNYAEQKADWGE